MTNIPERCLRCDWWNFNRGKCDRIFKAHMRISHDAGEITIETHPGVLPDYMEEELKMYLATVFGDVIDAWPGWQEIKRLRDGGKTCPAERPSAAIKNYGAKIHLVKPLGEAQPGKNLDANGLFKADISLL